MTLFTALADPTRFHIIEMLAERGQLPVSAIRGAFKISPPAVSQHLKVLKKANLVRVEVRAQQRIYALNPEGMDQAEQWIRRMKSMWESRFLALDTLLEEDMKQSTPISTDTGGLT